MSPVSPAERQSAFVRMAGLVLLNALIFHEVLARNRPGIALSLNTLLRRPPGAPSLQQRLADAWDRILETDYQPVFEAARRVLAVLPAGPNLEEALERLVRTALDTVASRVLLRHDLMGRIYHTLLMRDIAKPYATYYTSVPAAWMLARLALETPGARWDRFPWHDPSAIRSLRIGDLACGSGTLLSAVYHAVLDRHTQACVEKGVPPDLPSLHRALLEDALWGFEVLEYAAHLSATTLALHNPEADFSGTNIWVLPHTGGPEVRLGSLDYLAGGAVPLRMASVLPAPGPRRQAPTGVQEMELAMPEWDLVIMNPPFARSMGGNLLFGALPKHERSEMQKRLRKVVQEAGFSGIIQAGLGACFVVLADKYLKPGGRMALVLPKSVLSGVAWSKVRERLADRYEVEYIVLSHQAPNDWNFSENTHLGEALIVARKLREGEEPRKTLFVNLWRKPRNEWEALAFSEQIRRIREDALRTRHHDLLEDPNAVPAPLRYGGNGGLMAEKVGEAHAVSYDALADALVNWGQLAAFAQGELTRLAYALLARHALPGPVYLPLRPLRELVKHIGTDRPHRVQEFRQVPYPTAYPALWGHESERVRHLVAEPNAWAEPNPKQIKRALAIWERRARLMVAERLRLNTMRLIAVRTTEECIACEWWPIALKELDTGQVDKAEMAQAVWLNTSPVVVAWLALREDTEGGWVGLKKPHLEELPLLDPERLSGEQVEALAGLFERFAGEEFPPFPEQWEQARRGRGVRYELDRAVLRVLTGQEVDLGPVYEMLAREPIFTLRPLA